jgi:hypothetical protein
MLKFMLKWFLICIVGYAIIMAGILLIGRPVKGMYIWEGYAHAVAFCGGQVGFVLRDDEVTILGGKNYHIIINKGHEQDKEVNHLKVLALTECL